jgi:hypothetical protein
MNEQTTDNARRDEQPREPNGLVEVTRDELAKTEGGILMWPTINSYYLTSTLWWPT